MSVSREDYDGGAQLVPSGLRAYRHYRLDDLGLLNPVIIGNDPVLPGVNVAKCYAPISHRADKSCTACYGSGMRYNGYNGREVCTCLTECQAPSLDCTCGFYASYSPNLDFFAPGSGVAIHQASIEPTVFAVVEATGRVLMGSKGIRAEKLEVKAAAVDPSHVQFFNSMANVLKYACSKYGIPTYARISDMVEDFPQPDLSHLIENQES